jgi:hypothetical protein
MYINVYIKVKYTNLLLHVILIESIGRRGANAAPSWKFPRICPSLAIPVIAVAGPSRWLAVVVHGSIISKHLKPVYY